MSKLVNQLANFARHGNNTAAKLATVGSSLVTIFYLGLTFDLAAFGV